MYYEVDTANLTFTKDILNSYETDHGGNGNSNAKKARKLKQKKQKARKGQTSIKVPTHLQQTFLVWRR